MCSGRRLQEAQAQEHPAEVVRLTARRAGCTSPSKETPLEINQNYGNAVIPNINKQLYAHLSIEYANVIMPPPSISPSIYALNTSISILTKPSALPSLNFLCDPNTPISIAPSSCIDTSTSTASCPVQCQFSVIPEYACNYNGMGNLPDRHLQQQS